MEALASTSVRALACGHNHTAALTSDGVVYTWGGGAYGRLGHGDEDNQHTPKRVEALASVRALACGREHNAALTSDGAVYTWGGETHNKPRPISRSVGYSPYSQHTSSVPSFGELSAHFDELSLT